MRAGDRLGGRWRLEATLPTTGGVLRFSAIDESSGESVEVLALDETRASDDDRKAFREVHDAMRGIDTPGAVSTLTVEHGESRAWAVRPRLGEATLAELKAPMSGSAVAAIGASLLPAILAAGGSTRGTLLPTDIALDTEGRPVLAPRGTPLNQVVRGTTRASAPEVLAGRPADAASGLFGLGVMLYRLATGRLPAVATGGAPPAPPSSTRDGVPAALDEAILLLLSPDPAVRAGALPLLQSAADGEAVVDLRGRVQPRSVLGEVDTTADPLPSGSRKPRRDEPPRALVVVPHRALSRLDPAGRHAAAGVAGVSLAVVDEALERQLPLVVGGASLRVQAARDAQHLTERVGLPLEAGVTDAGRGLWLPLLAALAIGAPLALLTLVLGLFGVLWLAVPAALALAADGAFAVITWLTMRRWAADFGASAEAWRLVEHHREARAELGLQPVSDDLAAVRRQLAEADLPPAAASDLRSVLKEVDQRIESLAEQGSAAASALRQIDVAGLRGRLAAFDRESSLEPAQASERDRLTRIVADLDDVRGRQELRIVEATRLRDALAEVGAVLGRLAEDSPDEALAALGVGARHVEEAVRNAGADGDEARRRQERLVAQARAERTRQ